MTKKDLMYQIDQMSERLLSLQDRIDKLENKAPSSNIDRVKWEVTLHPREKYHSQYNISLSHFATKEDLEEAIDELLREKYYLTVKSSSYEDRFNIRIAPEEMDD